MTENAIEFGFIEKWLRTELELTIDNVSYDLKISKGNLSEMENGKRRMKKDQFLRFTSFYRIEFDFSDEVHREIFDLLCRLVDCLIYGPEYESQPQEILSKVKENRNLYSCSTGCLYLSVIDALGSLYSGDQNRAVNDFRKYGRMMDCYESDIQALLYLVFGIRAARSLLKEEAFLYLNRALAVHSGERWPQLKGVIRMHLGRALMQFDSFDSGLEMTRLARMQFYQYGNLRQAAICRYDEVLELIYMQAFNAALNILSELEKSRAILSSQKADDSMLSLMLLALVLKEDFVSALNLLRIQERQQSGLSEIFLLAPYLLYRQGDQKKARKAIKELKPFAAEPAQKMFLDLLLQIMTGNLERIERQKNRLMQLYARQYQWGSLMILSQLMICFYRNWLTRISGLDNQNPKAADDCIQPSDPAEELHVSRLLIESYAAWTGLLHHQIPNPAL